MPPILPRSLTVPIWAIALTSIIVTVPWRLMPVVAAIVGTGVILSILTYRIDSPTATWPVRGGRRHQRPVMREGDERRG